MMRFPDPESPPEAIDAIGRAVNPIELGFVAYDEAEPPEGTLLLELPPQIKWERRSDGWWKTFRGYPSGPLPWDVVRPVTNRMRIIRWGSKYSDIPLDWID